jgi:hypothetical protein
VRNRFVHELPTLLGTDDLAPDLNAFQELLYVFRKVEVWNVINLELEFHDEWRGKEIKDDDVVPGSMLMMQMLLDVALGDQEKAWSYYNTVVKKPADSGPSGIT